MHNHAVAGAAPMGGDLLCPLVRAVGGMRPTDIEVVIGHGAADLIEVRKHVGHALLDAVQRRDLVEGPVRPAFAARTIVSKYVDEQCIVQHVHVLEGIHETADLNIGVLGESRKGLHQPRRYAFLIRGQGIPRRDFLRPLGKLTVLRNDAELLLPRECLLAQLVPARIELAAVLLDPFLADRMGRMGRAIREIHEKRLVRRHCLLFAHIGDGLRREVLAEMIIRVIRRRHRRGSFK